MVLLTLAGCIANVHSALAAPPTTFSEESVSHGPFLAGESAMYTRSITTPNVTGFSIRSLALDGSRRVLFSDPDGYQFGVGASEASDFAASSAGIAAHYWGGTAGPGRSIRSTPSGFQPFGDEECSSRSLDVDGDLLAYACTAGYVTVRSLTTGAVVDTAGSNVQDVHIAGRFLAWTDFRFRNDSELVVHDRIAERDVYRIDVAALLPSSDQTYVRLDLAPDGTLVATYHNYGSPGTLAWFSPSEPFAHVIAQGILGDPAIAGDLIAIKRVVRGADWEFAVIDRAGRTVQVFDRDDPGWGGGELGFDGSMLAWYSHRKGLRLSRFPVDDDEFPPELNTARFSISPTRFRPVERSAKRSASRRRGATLRIKLRRQANLKVRIERAVAGRRANGACKPRSKRNRRGRSCIRYRRAGTLKLGRRNGAFRVRFTGRVGTGKLRAGRYRAVVYTQLGRGRAVRERAARFQILR